MNNKVKFGAIGGFVVLLTLAGLGAAKLEEKKPGEACETYNSSACGGTGGACLASNAGNYCSVACKTNADCPGASWQCAEIAQKTFSAKTGGQTAESAIKMCVKN